jgi:hypothetical protein
MLRVIVFFIILSLYLSCTDNWRKALEKVDNPYLKKVPLKNWTLSQEDKLGYEDYYSVVNIYNDTTFIMYFAESKSDGLISVYGLRKRFKCDYDTCNLYLDSKDTVYYYRENSSGTRNFIVGEYAYRFERLLLDSTEMKIYFDKKDSLRRIRGNNLPKINFPN